MRRRRIIGHRLCRHLRAIGQLTRGIVAVSAVFIASGGAGTGASPDSVDVLLHRAREYVTHWQEQLSGLVSEEQYQQHVKRRFGYKATARQLRSDFLLVKVQRLWVGFRDIAEVDGHAIQGRGHRLEELFLNHPLPEALQQARRISNESARYNLGRVYQNFNVPTTALQILEASRGARIRFRRESDTTRDGHPAAVISFDEKEPPTIILIAGTGDYVFSHGRFWVDPSSGQILATELRWRLSARGEGIDMIGTVAVNYREEPKIGVSVPQEMTEKYDTTDEKVEGHAVYSNVRRFSVAVSDDVTLPR